jgi:hypothetical protein
MRETASYNRGVTSSRAPWGQKVTYFFRNVKPAQSDTTISPATVAGGLNTVQMEKFSNMVRSRITRAKRGS